MQKPPKKAVCFRLPGGIQLLADVTLTGASSRNRGARASIRSPPDQRAGTPATSRRTSPRVSGRWRGALRGRAPDPPPRCRSPTRVATGASGPRASATCAWAGGKALARRGEHEAGSFAVRAQHLRASSPVSMRALFFFFFFRRAPVARRRPQGDENAACRGARGGCFAAGNGMHGGRNGGC